MPPEDIAALRLELKNVIYNSRLSQETPCFTASLWLNGKAQGHAYNHGHGGATMVEPLALCLTLNNYGAALPPLEIASGDGTSITLRQTAETIIDDLLTTWLYSRDLRRLLTSHLVYTRSDKPGIYHADKLDRDNLKRQLTQIDTIRHKLKIEQCLNSISFDDALTIYRKTSER